jgi:hypothetical protein
MVFLSATKIMLWCRKMIQTMLRICYIKNGYRQGIRRSLDFHSHLILMSRSHHRNPVYPFRLTRKKLGD